MPSSLTMLLPSALGFSPSSTCVGLRYGYDARYSGFSWHMAHTLPYFCSVHVTASDCMTDFPITLLPRLYAAFHSAPVLSTCVPTVLMHHSTGISTCCPSATSFDLALGPDFPEQISFTLETLDIRRKDSHLPLATHSGILSSINSTAPSGTASLLIQCSSTNLAVPQLRRRVSAPDIFGAGPLDQ